MVKKALSSDFDPHRAAFFMADARGPCRFGQYNRLHRIVLDELGLEEVPILVLDQSRNYQQHVTRVGSGFRLLTWRGLTILDSMQKMLLERRPYEVNKGEADAVYQEWLQSLVRIVEQGGGGFEAVFPELSQILAVNRVQELVGTGAEIIVTHCPGCVMQIKVGLKEIKRSDIKVFDLAQIVAMALEL